LVLLFLVPHIRHAHSRTDQDYRDRYHGRDTNHGVVASRPAYLDRFHLHLPAYRLTEQLGLGRRGVDMRLQVSQLLSQELLVQIPRVEGREGSFAGTAGCPAAGEASIVPERQKGLV